MLLLHWRPDDFWNATPAEVATVLGAVGAGAGDDGLDAERFAQLKDLFPDG